MSSHLPVHTPITAQLIRGAVELEHTTDGIRPHRLPVWARQQALDPQLTMVEAQPSGVRLLFQTSSSQIEVLARPTKCVFDGLPPRPDGVYDFVVDEELVDQGVIVGGNTMELDILTRVPRMTHGPIGRVRFRALAVGPKIVEIWLPHDEATELVAVRSDRAIRPVPQHRARWVHHGSSISHGSNASQPTGTWPVIAARAAQLDITNLGFGGGALLDPFTARVIRDEPADFISLKLGINVVNADVMRLRAFKPSVHGFLDTIRDGHATTPILVMSPILCPIIEHTPGPTPPDPTAFAAGDVRFVAKGNSAEVADGRLTLSVIRETLANIVRERSESDSNLYYLDGTALYGTNDQAVHPLVDNLHPDGETHALMASRFVKLVLAKGGLIAATSQPIQPQRRSHRKEMNHGSQLGVQDQDLQPSMEGI